jgi:glycosyltransferase involved in cell wall biosynthesis
MNYQLSIIVPVYNRPDEVAELLESLALQEGGIPFEVIIVEDGSDITCEHIVKAYSNKFSLSYHYIPNGGPAPARNYGAGKAQGEYLIILDSDCVVPPAYLQKVQAEINLTQADAFGGPDRADSSFSDIQKAINYSMTSFFTTGGIRGGKKKLDKFYPRSFNMGIRKDIFMTLGGFADMRYGEDIDFSLRICEAGYKVCLFADAWVYHRRRTNWDKFYRQVYHSGEARIDLWQRHTKSLKAVHLLPAVFTLGVVLFAAGGLFCRWSLLPLAVYAVLVFVDSTIKNKSAGIGALSIVASYTQLIGYGCGFLKSFVQKIILRQKLETAKSK